MIEEILNKKLTRREFLKRTFCLYFFGNLFFDFLNRFNLNVFAQDIDNFYLYEARFYKKIDNKTVQCQLCPRGCTLTNGQRSFCRAREPKDGKLYSLVYNKPCAIHIDPIEKKPLFHFLPATTAFSIATSGCNFRCKFCQNWQISQFPPEEVYNYTFSCNDIVDLAIKNNSTTIAYTYTEPSIFYEYMFDTAKIAKEKGIRNIYHSNGSLKQKPLEELCKYLDAANIDLKAFNQKFYNDICAGYLDVVLETLKILKKNNVWLEITNLVIPTLNDNIDEIKSMCNWIVENLGKDVPIHFSRFWPQYKLTNLAPTPVETLERARAIALSCGLEYVYIGNVPGHSAENTYCPKCKKILIRRIGFSVLEKNITDRGNCKFCGYDISGVWI